MTAPGPVYDAAVRVIVDTATLRTWASQQAGKAVWPTPTEVAHDVIAQAVRHGIAREATE